MIQHKDETCWYDNLMNMNNSEIFDLAEALEVSPFLDQKEIVHVVSKILDSEILDDDIREALLCLEGDLQNATN